MSRQGGGTQSPALPGWGNSASTAKRQGGVLEPAQHLFSAGGCGVAAAAVDGEWTVVGRPSGGAPRSSSQRASLLQEAIAPQACCESMHSELPPAAPASRSRPAQNKPRPDLIARALEAVAADTLVTTVVRELERLAAGVHRVLLLGVGSPTTSAASRHQLALALLLFAALRIDGQLLVFDPVLDSDDAALLVRHDCRILSASEAQTAHTVLEGQRTLFIMPHCEAALYDAVLAKNWSATGLSRLVILGNSFAEYADRNSLRASDSECACRRVVRVQPYASELALTCLREHPVSAFNNLSLHHFEAARLAGMDLGVAD